MKFKLPTLHPIRLQPQPIEEDDELLQAITNDPSANDNRWELNEFVDGEALTNFWEEVVQERAEKAR